MWWDERVVYASSYYDVYVGEKLKAVVDLDCEYTRGLVLESFERRPEWEVLDASKERDENDQSNELIKKTPLFFWGEYEEIDWKSVESGGLHCSCYCIRKGLIRKAHLAHNLKKWAAKRPNGWIAKSVPETFIMDVDDPEYIEEALCDVPEVRDMADGSAVWIAKPSITNQALSICIFDKVDTLKQAIEESENVREWVLQRYIHPPLLIDHRKFHLRVYALCVGSLSVYVFTEVLVLLAGTRYDGDLNNLKEHSSHLTNTCRQEQMQDEGDLVKLLSELPEVLASQGMSLDNANEKVNGINDSIQNIIGECFEAVSRELTFFTLPNCFELFGFDLMVDANWRSWLLEANAEPDFRQTGGRLRKIIQGVIEGTFRLFVDPLAKHHGVDSNVDGTKVGQGEWVKVFETQQRRPF